MGRAAPSDQVSRSSTPERLGHRPALDGIRALAIASVVVFHLVAFFFTSHVSKVDRGGFLGVDVFFVLSGFLITTLLLEERSGGRVSLAWFWQRRVLRLLPALIVFLVVWTVYLAGYRHLGLGGILKADLESAFYISNFAKAHGATIDPGYGHMWSLAIEEQFYLVWPVVVVIVMARSKRVSWLGSLAALAVGALSIDRALVWHANPDPLTVVFRTDFHADQLLIGGVAAIVWRCGGLRWISERSATISLLSFIGLVASFALIGESDSWLYEGGYLLFGVLVVALTISVLEPRGFVGWLLSSRPVQYLGQVSYSLYLWHFAVITAVAYSMGHRLPGVAALLSVAISVILATISYHYLEQPTRRAGRRYLEARRSRRLAATYDDGEISRATAMVESP